jgi:hypothetical protein
MSSKIGKKLYTNVPQPIAEQVTKMADSEGRTISQMIAILIEEALKKL